MCPRKARIAEEISRHLSALGADSQVRMVLKLRELRIVVSQATLSRLLSGNYAGAPKSLRKICDQFKIDLNFSATEVDPAQCEVLIDALRAAWDGSPEGAIFVARVIKAAGRLHREITEK